MIWFRLQSVQMLELAHCLLKLLLCFFKLLALVEELAEGLALLDALDAGERLARVDVEEELGRAVRQDRKVLGLPSSEQLSAV